MSPESLKEPPRYTEKLDVFSQGVIMIQVCTRKFPDPGPAMKEIEDVRSPTGSIHIPILEPERRKKNIDLIDPTHPLLPIALGCLEYRERDRPSAEELCQRLAALKESQEYIESSQHTTPATPEVNGTLQQERDELARQVEEKTREIATKNEQIATKDEQIAEYQQDISTKDRQIAAHQQKIRMKSCDLSAKNEQIATKDCEIRELNQRLVDNEQVTAQFQETNQQLQRQISDLQKQNGDLSQQQPKVLPVPKPRMRSTEGKLELKWRDGVKAPFKDCGESSVVEGNLAYFLSDKNLYSYDSLTREWNTRLPPCPQRFGSLAIIQGLLTMVGGDLILAGGQTTNKLVSLTKREEGGKWIEQFPPMLTSRRDITAITYQNHLIVAGGSTTAGYSDSLDTVEVLHLDSLVWSTAASLQHPFSHGSATICGDRLYLLGGNDKIGSCRSVFWCLLSELLQSCYRPSLVGWLTKPSQSGVWQCTTDTPMYKSTCATVRGQLVAVGGRDTSTKETTAVYKYDPNTRSWNIISHMKSFRRSCYVAVMDTNEILVVSGFTIENHGLTDSVEIASF